MTFSAVVRETRPNDPNYPLPSEIRHIPLPLSSAHKARSWPRHDYTCHVQSTGEVKLIDRNPNSVLLHPADLANLFDRLRQTPHSVRFVLAARLYATAMSLIHERADLAYLLLTEAIETLATQAIDAEQAVKESGEKPPKYFTLRAQQLAVAEEAASELWGLKEAKNRGPTFQFREYACRYAPEALWNAPDDLFHLNMIASMSPQKSNLKQIAKVIYDQRSNFVHNGTPYPEMITIGLGPTISHQAFTQGVMAAINGGLSLPPVAWFERLVHLTIVEHLRGTT